MRCSITITWTQVARSTLASALACLTIVAAAPAASAQQVIFQTGAPPGLDPSGMPPRDRPVKDGTAVLRGSVVAADTGQPLRRAQVRITAPDIRENRMTTTDADGRYEFKEVIAARYNVVAQKGSYVTLQYGQRRPFEAGKPLEVLDGQTIEKIDFALPRGAVMTGRVFDEFGDPLSDVQVSAMRYQVIGGRRRLVVAGRPAMTNDVGEFRLFALPPGQYYVSATLRSGMIGDTNDRTGYAPTYYPGTPNIAEAPRLTVTVAQTLSDLSIALTPSRTARVSGVATDSQGRPMGGMVMAVPKSDTTMLMLGPPGQIRPDGSFSVGGLAPGTYRLQVQSGPGDAETATAEVTVNGEDIAGLRLAGSKPSTLSGRVLTPAGAAQSVRPSQFRLVATPAEPEVLMLGPGTGPAAANDDWTFELKARAGQPMRIQLAGSPSGWAIHAVRYRGTDVTDSGVEFRAGEDVGDLEVEVTNAITEVGGLVTNNRGETVTDYSVVVFARDREHWNPGSRYLRSGRPDQDGRFKVTALPAGSYYAIALDYIETGDATDPEVLDRIRDKAIGFTLADGEKKTLDLKLTSAAM